MADTIITSTTSATKSEPISCDGNESFAVVGSIASGEYIDLQYSTDGGATWKDLYQDGSQVRMTDTNLVISIYRPVLLKFDKDATAASVGLIRYGG